MKINLNKQKIIKILVPILVCGLALAVMLASALMLVSSAMVNDTEPYIRSEEEANELYNIDCIIVLGALVRDNGTPSDMLRDRLDVAIALYKMGISDRILMSGDHGSVGYNEVGIMKKYALEQGVQEEHIFMDHAGFSTYETMVRAKEVFLTESYYKRVIIVTQKYHLHRALYIANSIGLDAYGVASDLHTYSGQWMRDVREVLARFKDFFYCYYGAEPKYLGGPISIFGNGNDTNDEYYDNLFK